jgi:hypothetical protein
MGRVVFFALQPRVKPPTLRGLTWAEKVKRPEGVVGVVDMAHNYVSLLATLPDHIGAAFRPDFLRRGILPAFFSINQCCFNVSHVCSIHSRGFFC